jgi:hypothetical protein
MTGTIPTTYSRLQAGTKWNQAASNMGDAVLSQTAVVRYTDVTASPKTLFRVPAYTQAVTFVVGVTTAFDASTLNMLSVGVSGNVGYFLSGISVGSAGIADISVSSNLNNWSSVGSSDVIVIASHSSTGTGATQGVALVTMLYSMKS